ncbi:MAG: hypothetical protein ABSB75_01405 [Candidatus Limnocylindrales bacterium]
MRILTSSERHGSIDRAVRMLGFGTSSITCLSDIAAMESALDALSDGAYSSPDEYVGEEDTGWLDHWAITRGRPPQKNRRSKDPRDALPASIKPRRGV